MRVGIIGRFRPLHIGSARMLSSICEVADSVVIGIGSSNKLNVRNPFTAKETAKMIDLYLGDSFRNYSIIPIPDFGHLPGGSDGQMWKRYVVDNLGELDLFVSGNEYVRELLCDTYKLARPSEILPREKFAHTRGSETRLLMAKNKDWQSKVPNIIARHIMDNDLDEVFRKQYGKETIAKAEVAEAHLRAETVREEYLHTLEG